MEIDKIENNVTDDNDRSDEEDHSFDDLTQYGYISLKFEVNRPSDSAPFTHESVLRFT